MAIIKSEVVDTITILENGNLEIRNKVKLIENGIEIAFTYNRYVIEPGDNVNQLPTKIKSVAALIHTPEVIAAAQQRKAKVVL